MTFEKVNNHYNATGADGFIYTVDEENGLFYTMRHEFGTLEQAIAECEQQEQCAVAWMNLANEGIIACNHLGEHMQFEPRSFRETMYIYCPNKASAQKFCEWTGMAVDCGWLYHETTEAYHGATLYQCKGDDRYKALDEAISEMLYNAYNAQ